MLSKETCEVDGVGSILEVATWSPAEEEAELRIEMGKVSYYNPRSIGIYLLNNRSTFRSAGTCKAL